MLDVRYQLGRSDGHEQYLAGHVPGAVYVDLATDLADPPADPVDARGRHPLPDPDRFAEAMRAAGVRTGRPVVVYDDWSSMAATRAWWLLRFHGHDDVRVLDGGWSWWTRSGADLETGERDVEPGDFRADPGHLPVVDADGAARVARDGVLLDARAAERFRGEVEPIDPVAGHVPGAVNVPTALNVRGRSLPDDGRARGRLRHGPRGRRGRGVLRLRRHRDPRPVRAAPARPDRGALPRQLERLGERRGASGHQCTPLSSLASSSCCGVVSSVSVPLAAAESGKTW